MPRVKFDYVVSFSSEDPDNQASNLLAVDVSKKKWLCSKGEPSCSVVLQLVRAVKISAVHIGAYHTALVEVLVGRSETPNDPYQVLVPSSVFLSPIDSRRDEPVDKVRSFSSDQLSADAREKRWDRIRVVCSQPYNKHCKYGLSFIQVYEPEGKEAPPSSAAAPAVPTRMMTLEMYSSDEDDLRPGELFAKYKQGLVGDGGTNSVSTDAQIRQATSQALKNIPDSATRLTRASIDKPSPRRKSPVDDRGANRQRDNLMYTDDDQQPHAKIDHIVNRHKDEKKELVRKETEEKRRQEKKDDAKRNESKDDKVKTHQGKNDGAGTSKEKERDRSKDKERDRSKDKQRDSRKRSHDDEKDKVKKGVLRAGPVSESPHTLFRGVVFALSGYENPRRAAVRDAALALGARYERDWGPRCTHLVCAFANTPKLKTVRGSPNGAAAVVVTAEWVERCCDERRLLPWQWFATEPKHRVAPTESDDDGDRRKNDGGGDRSEKERSHKKRRRDESPAPAPRHSNDTQQQGKRVHRSPTPRAETSANLSSGSDVTFVRDERLKGNVTIVDSDSDDNATDCEAEVTRVVADDKSKALPDFFEGYTFTMEEGLDAALDRGLLARYVRAYGGVLLEASQLDDETGVDYVLCGRGAAGGAARGRGRGGGRGGAVRADWVWRCHERQALCPVAEYSLT